MMNGYNDNITDQQLAKLQELFPEAFTEGKVNWSQLRATLGDAIEGGDSYGLSWKGKAGVFAKIQERTVETLHPDRDNSVDWDTTDNMFIEGDNLAALKILHKSYYGRVKMIYIDPPYNTGNDFVYNDDFKQTRKSYEADAGIVDDEGNITRDDGLRANTGGHKHSNWLNMMYPRLFLARNLLRQDGVIFVSIDDNEVHNLRLIMNEIFGEENFVAQLNWQTKKAAQGMNTANMIVDNHEYILVYARKSEYFRFIGLDRSDDSFSNPDNDPRGLWKRQYLQRLGQNLPVRSITDPATGNVFSFETPYTQDKLEKWIDEGRIIFPNDVNKYPARKEFLNEYSEKQQLVTSLGLFATKTTTEQLYEYFDGRKVFNNPKPHTLIKFLIRTTIDEGVILDFFSGSGTTAHAVAELNAEDGGNRKWICVQLPEQTSEKSEAFRAGYANIADIARERIRRAGAKIRTDFAEKIAERKTPLDLGFRAYRVGDSNFKPWNELVADPEEIRQQMLNSLDPIEPDATDESILTELLLKRGISPLTEIETYDDFVFVPSENLVISLSSHMTEELFAQILTKSPSRIILLDRAFSDDISLKTNLILQAEKQSIAVEVV
ncbi:MAG: site-specific DNA-methyltransferase [Candidatus Saccharibacteria bacterium]|nr:site-specific DNA-methyltransferase [Candidatus Saccharibacteria bacterium]